MNGGVAEFKTIDTLNSSIGHYFSDFVSFVEWKGVAIANMGTTSAEVTLYALGRSIQGSGGAILGTFALVIPPKDKIVGFHSAWFSSVELSQIESIVAVTSSQSLCGITIVGDFALARLLFTPAALVTNFNPNVQTTGWDLNSTVNMDGTFPATADLVLTTNGVLFSAALTTKLIGGASEVHSFTLNGTTNGTTYTVTNQTFSITVGGTLETFTMNASFVITGNSLSGSGTLTGSHNGSFTVTGTKKI
jgi:hypothetical protein